MKKFILYSVLVLVYSCGGPGSSEENAKNPESRKISKRDYSITSANSYTDLFLDSTDVEKFIIDSKVPDELSYRIRSFYNTRNFQFAWFSQDGLTEQARGFWNLHDYVNTYGKDSTLMDKSLQKKMDNLITEENLTIAAGNKSYTQTELTLTRHFIQYMLNNYEKGFVKRKEMERFVPRKKEDALYLADSLMNKKHKDDKYFEDVNPSYKGLKEQMGRYYTIVKQGGWPSIPAPKKTLKKGITDTAIVLIKKRLQVSGDMTAGDSSNLYNDELETAIRSYQGRHGFTPNGQINKDLIAEMNVPAISRLEQILMNMDRMRWLAAEPPANLIVVNIPEFILHAYEGHKKVFDMVVVVGKEGHNTMMFNGDLNQVVFSPYWNVPPSIVTKELLPEMEKNENYLSSQNMEIVGETDNIPVIRQKPGTKNALGKVKFLFPNSFNIYFHDTPSKSLFEKDMRAYSHGCIRLKEPEKMANYVLRNQSEWTPEKIDQAMNSGEEKFVKVKNPIPVVITYYTSWVDETGQLNFRQDIYGHDSRLASRMFRKG